MRVPTKEGTMVSLVMSEEYLITYPHKYYKDPLTIPAKN